jgi:phosphatidylglycerophosphate synthase
MLAKMIPTKTHAGLDYAVGLLLIASPWLFGFADESTAATWVAVLAGVAVLGLSMITDYEGGLLARLIPMRTHLMADAGLGLLLTVSPWLFGFADKGTNAWLPFVAIGLGEISSAMTTDPEPGKRSRRRSTARSAA